MSNLNDKKRTVALLNTKYSDFAVLAGDIINKETVKSVLLV
jgi:hypothetical protein